MRLTLSPISKDEAPGFGSGASSDWLVVDRLAVEIESDQDRIVVRRAVRPGSKNAWVEPVEESRLVRVDVPYRHIGDLLRHVLRRKGVIQRTPPDERCGEERQEVERGGVLVELLQHVPQAILEEEDRIFQ